MAVAIYHLVRMENKMKNLENAINSLAIVINEMKK
ncbi:YvrJ family protein [bacterium]|nr:YvrJ family protein [bacterium]MBU4511369.1 YvrJ family protein [bacterium]